MRRLLFALCLALAGCAAVTTQIDTYQSPEYQARLAAVEVGVTSDHPALIAQIRAGDGPLIDQIMDRANIPPGDRDARLLQLQGDLGLYAASPGALIQALMTYGAPRAR